MSNRSHLRDFENEISELRYCAHLLTRQVEAVVNDSSARPELRETVTVFLAYGVEDRATALLDRYLKALGE